MSSVNFDPNWGSALPSDAYARQTISSEAAAAPAPEKTAKSPNGGASLRRFAALEGFCQIPRSAQKTRRWQRTFIVSI